jgi:hypothetical protein
MEEVLGRRGNQVTGPRKEIPARKVTTLGTLPHHSSLGPKAVPPTRFLPSTDGPGEDCFRLAYPRARPLRE